VRVFRGETVRGVERVVVAIARIIIIFIFISIIA
jgi:hypothetical protein